MKKLIFVWLLKKFTKREKQRLFVLKVLFENICEEYSEQTLPGNIYNFLIEFAISNFYINKEIIKDRLNQKKDNLDRLKKISSSALDKASEFIIEELIENNK